MPRLNHLLDALPSAWRSRLSGTRWLAHDFFLRIVLFLRWTFRNAAPARKHALPGRLIVSLTSFPLRFPTLALTLKSLLCQSVRPDAVILWIAEEDRDRVPADVMRLTQHGLKIEYCDNLRSYKKIIPCLLRYPGSFIATADDDLYYWSNWLAGLVQAFDPRVWEVICYRAHLIRLDAAGTPAEYKNWAPDIDAGAASGLIFPTGMGGILYRPGILHPDVTDVEAFMRLCPTADDIWLYFMARMTGATWRKIGRRRHLRPWIASQQQALWTVNLAGGANDIQLRSMLQAYGFDRPAR